MILSVVAVLQTFAHKKYGMFYARHIIIIMEICSVKGFFFDFTMIGYYSALGIRKTPPLKKEPVSSPEILSVYFPAAASPFS